MLLVVIMLVAYGHVGMAMNALDQKQKTVARQQLDETQQRVGNKKSSDSAVKITEEHKDYKIGDVTISVVKGDITKAPVDAIVNAANAGLWAGGGVCGAIFAAAGKENLENAVSKIQSLPQQEEDRVGGAWLTPVTWKSNLPLTVKSVIHAVGPNCGDKNQEKDKKNLLANAYKNSLFQADKAGAKSIAFPAISTAIFGYNIKEATPVALDALIETAPKTGIKHILCMFLGGNANEGYDLYTAYLDEKSKK